MTARTLGSTFDREMADGRFCRVQNRLVDTGGVVSVVSDISDLKQHAEQLAVARDHSEEATRAKSRFLATMSHEIRTPLNGVLGMAQAMANDTLSKPQRERLDVIQKSGESLLTVLNDVLDMSKIEAGKLEIEEIAFDLETVALTVTAAFDAVAAAKALALRLTLQPGAEGHYLGDPTRLRQILMNLVSNALKFTERGFIDIEIKPALGGLDFAVRDSGIGMTPDQCSGLFQTFSQADPSTTRKYGGTGLGLAICQELSLLMSGSLGVQSVLGQGSVFSLFLPLRPVPEESAAPRPEPQRQDQIIDLRVLAAEDNSVNQLVLTTLLGQAGVTPVIVENGVQAIEAWSLSDWDLILMDIQMPVMDGPTASREIRSREAIEGRPRTPIIALTANAMTHQVQEYLDAGMDGFVAKPIEIARLFDTIDQVLRAATEDRPGATPIENSAA
jgi:signal transduction histidine kinase